MREIVESVARVVAAAVVVVAAVVFVAVVFVAVEFVAVEFVANKENIVYISQRTFFRD